ncbi:phage GP46 family protein [Burkholderia sp. MSHR3999]|uniref:phage GP46 family protein n=1 Tax=Burkholderia sp. MSHR3999 TaxID=1542965 RepID=UPI0005B6D646|nr:phage GP46 family protein [Burkholderia sp. MSHR3999]KIP14293.1 phage GP46 family protein [Burkholderia sp. MSHR3999]
MIQCTPTYGDGWDFVVMPDPSGANDFTNIPDWQVKNGDLAADNQLHSAVIIQLFTEARAPADCPFLDNPEDRRGWWGDVYSPFPVGSLLWVLYRQALTDKVIEHARSYASDAMQRLVDQGAAARQECIITADKPQGAMFINPVLYGRDGRIIYNRAYRRYWT